MKIISAFIILWSSASFANTSCPNPDQTEPSLELKNTLAAETLTLLNIDLDKVDLIKFVPGSFQEQFIQSPEHTFNIMKNCINGSISQTIGFDIDYESSDRHCSVEVKIKKTQKKNNKTAPIRIEKKVISDPQSCL